MVVQANVPCPQPKDSALFTSFEFVDWIIRFWGIHVFIKGPSGIVPSPVLQPLFFEVKFYYLDNSLIRRRVLWLGH